MIKINLQSIPYAVAVCLCALFCLTDLPVLAKWGYADKSGKVVIPAQFDQAEEFSESLAQVKKDGKAFFVDATGKVVLDPHCDFAGKFSLGLAPVAKGKVFIYVD